jgi:hypothetical protein
LCLHLCYELVVNRAADALYGRQSFEVTPFFGLLRGSIELLVERIFVRFVTGDGIGHEIIGVTNASV